MLRQTFVPEVAFSAHLAGDREADVGATSPMRRVTGFRWLIRLPGPDVSKARHLASPSEAGAGLRGVFEESWSHPAVMSAHCVISQFGFLFTRRVDASLSLLLFIFSSLFLLPPPVIDRPGVPPLVGWDITKSSGGICWSYPLGNLNTRVKFLRQRTPLFCTQRRMEEASLASPPPGLKKNHPAGYRGLSLLVPGCHIPTRPSPGHVRFSPIHGERTKL